MIEILTQAAAQVPALVVLCLLVYIFVGSLKAERTAIETMAGEALDRNTEAMANNQQVLQAAVESINRNTEMLGRTLAVNNVKTKYFLLLDDDHLFSDGTDIPGMRRILESTDIDILGGRMEKESGNWHTIDVSNGVLREQRDRNKYGELAGCLVCDKVANFMLARTARVRAMGGWPEELKIGAEEPGSGLISKTRPDPVSFPFLSPVSFPFLSFLCPK